MRTLDECVLGEYAECLEPVQVMVKYFCGTDIKQCGMMSTDGHDWTKVAEATERAKRIIAQNFYVVGVLGKLQCISTLRKGWLICTILLNSINQILTNTHSQLAENNNMAQIGFPFLEKCNLNYKRFINLCLEHFTTTLALFEKMLPEYYEGAVEASQTPGNVF